MVVIRRKKESLDKIRDTGTFHNKVIRKRDGKLDLERTKNLRQHSAEGMRNSSEKTHDNDLSDRYIKKVKIATAAKHNVEKMPEKKQFKKVANESVSFLNFEII